MDVYRRKARKETRVEHDTLPLAPEETV